MSKINLIVIEKKKIYHMEEHWRNVIEMFNGRLEDISGSKVMGRLDEGYILIDFDSQLIINCQQAFSFSDLSRDSAEWLMEGWRLFQN